MGGVGGRVGGGGAERRCHRAEIATLNLTGFAILVKSSSQKSEKRFTIIVKKRVVEEGLPGRGVLLNSPLP